MEFGLFASAFGWTPDVVCGLTIQQLEGYSATARSQASSFIPSGLPPVQQPQPAPTESHGTIENKDFTSDFTKALHRLIDRTGKKKFSYDVVYGEMKQMEKGK